MHHNRRTIPYSILAICPSIAIKFGVQHTNSKWNMQSHSFSNTLFLKKKALVLLTVTASTIAVLTR